MGLLAGVEPRVDTAFVVDERFVDVCVRFACAPIQREMPVPLSPVPVRNGSQSVIDTEEKIQAHD